MTPALISLGGSMPRDNAAARSEIHLPRPLFYTSAAPSAQGPARPLPRRGTRLRRAPGQVGSLFTARRRAPPSRRRRFPRRNFLSKAAAQSPSELAGGGGSCTGSEIEKHGRSLRELGSGFSGDECSAALFKVRIGRITVCEWSVEVLLCFQ